MLATGALARPVLAGTACVPVARVEGTGAEWSDVVTELGRRGIATSSIPEGCSVVRAELRQVGEGLVVRVVDADGRTTERTTHTPAAAATFIESWTRGDVVAPLLVARADPAIAHRVPTPDKTTTPNNSRLATALSLSTAAETSVATDGSIWFGVNAGVCVPIGPVCAGALARVASDSGWAGDSEDQRSSRLAADVLLGAAFPTRRGRLTVLPGLGLGLGWMRIASLRSTSGTGPVNVDTGGVRASASLRMSFRLLDEVALDLGLAADLAPLAHTALYDTRTTFLSGEPLAYFRLGLGVRIGLP
jgi:hypothetical protein